MTITPATAAFGASKPHQAAFIVYINGLEVPAKSVSLRYGVWQIPEMQIEMVADPVLVRLGQQDRIQVAVFYYDDCAVTRDTAPAFRLFGEGEITGWGYRNTSNARSIIFTVVNQIAIYTQLFVQFMTTLDDMIGHATDTSISTVGNPSSDLVYPFALFTQGLVPGAGKDIPLIKRPFDFLYNTVKGMIGKQVPTTSQTIPAANFFARWARLTNFHNRFVATPTFDQIVDNNNVFPVLRAVQDVAATDVITKNLLPQIQNNGSILDMLQITYTTMLMEVAMIPSMPLVTVDLVTGLIKRTDFTTHTLSQDATGIWVPTLSVDSRKTSPKRLPNYFAKPQMLFAIPPSCNVVFPSQLKTMAYDENYATQPTRLYFNDETMTKILKIPKGGLADTIHNALVTGYPPAANIIAKQHNSTHPKFNGKNFLLYPEEFFKGPVMDRREIPPWLFFLKAGEIAKNNATPKTQTADGQQTPLPPPGQTTSTAPPTTQPPQSQHGTATVAPTNPLPGRWVWPVVAYGGRPPVVSQGFNPSPGNQRGVTHPGVDIFFRRIDSDPYPNHTMHRSNNFVMPDGVTVCAAHDGVIWSAGNTPTGYTVVIDHGPLKTATYYTHMSSLFVTETQKAQSGERVTAGTPLGIVGFAPMDGAKLMHLHFELWFAGPNDMVDPEPYMSSWDIIGVDAVPKVKKAPVTPMAAASVTPSPTTPTTPIPPQVQADASASTETVYDLYAKFEFFRERYAKRTGSATIAWNPYVVPGFPAVIFDNRASSVDIVCYITTVQQFMSHDGQRNTTLSFMYGRHLQEMLGLLKTQFDPPSNGPSAGAAPAEPVRDVRKIVQSFSQAEVFYQTLFHGGQSLKAASFDFRDVVGYAADNPNDPPTRIEVDGPDEAANDAIVAANTQITNLTPVRDALVSAVQVLQNGIDAANATITDQNTSKAVNSSSIDDASSIPTADAPDVSLAVSTPDSQELIDAQMQITLLTPQLALFKTQLAAVDAALGTALATYEANKAEAKTGTSAHTRHTIDPNRSLVPLANTQAMFDNRDEAMRYNWRPICTLDEYIIFYNSAGEKQIPAFGHQRSVGARYFDRIRHFLSPPPGFAPAANIDGLSAGLVQGLTSANFPQISADWDATLQAYKDNVLNNKAPRT